jgi:hypothetical protein
MPTLDPTAAVPRTDDYWTVVVRTVVDVFDGTPYAAADLRQQVTSTAPDEQALFLHAEPLDVAADLVGRAPSDPEIVQYDDLCRRLGWL